MRVPIAKGYRSIALAVVAQAFDDYRRNYIRKLDQIRHGKDPATAVEVMDEVNKFVQSEGFETWCRTASINHVLARRAFGDRKREWQRKYRRAEEAGTS